jgi:hypothetical protein
MTSFIEPEKPIGLREAALIARVGHSGTIARWILKGVRGPNGEQIKLEGERVGGQWRTTAEAIARFKERLQPPDVVPLGSPVRGPTAREQACRRAEKELQTSGW